MIKLLVVASNMFEEIASLKRWFGFVNKIADSGILIVDSGSKDGTIECARDNGAVVIVDDIIRREGYGPARNHLRQMSKQHFPDAHWMIYLDADETIDPEDFHQLRYIKDYLVEDYDVIALPRIDWEDEKRSFAHNDFHFSPDFQARMSRLGEDVRYVRKLHEQVVCKKLYTNITNPKINHFHRSAPQTKRDLIGRLCAKLHLEDKDYGHTVPEHPKEAMYREQYLKEGL